MQRPASSNQGGDTELVVCGLFATLDRRSLPVDDGDPTPADRPMPRREIQPSGLDLLNYELAQEKASALGRLGGALESALEALARFDAGDQRDTPPAEGRQLRTSLVAEASNALWHFVVQREAGGLRDLRYVLRDYRVPGEVVARMGAWPDERARARMRKA